MLGSTAVPGWKYCQALVAHCCHIVVQSWVAVCVLFAGWGGSVERNDGIIMIMIDRRDMVFLVFKHSSQPVKYQVITYLRKYF